MQVPDRLAICQVHCHESRSTASRSNRRDDFGAFVGISPCNNYSVVLLGEEFCSSSAETASATDDKGDF
jgi:hypothetical protein